MNYTAMKEKDIATGRAQAEELDPLHAARTTSMGNDRGSESNPLSLEEFRQLRMQGDFAPYWVKIGEKLYFAPYGEDGSYTFGNTAPSREYAQVQLNSRLIDKTDIGVASTLLHELAHARQVCPLIEHGIRQCQKNH